MTNKSNNSTNEKLVWEEDGIIMTVCVGGLGEEKAKEFIEGLSKALSKFQEKGKVLIDGSGGGVTRSSKIRKIYVEFGKNIRADKVAIFGANTFQRVVAGFVIKAIGKLHTNIKFFKTREEALKWLKG